MTRLLFIGLFACIPFVAVAENQHRAIGKCQVVEDLVEPSTGLSNGISPVFDVGSYFVWFEKKEISEAGNVTLLRAPTHGALEVTGINGWNYVPSKDNHQGTDSATFLVEVDEYSVELTYGFKVVDFIGSGYEGATIHEYPENCPNGEFWEISSDGDITPLYLEEEEEDRG